MARPLHVTERDWALYQILRSVAERYEATPTHSQLSALLTEAGFPTLKNGIWEVVNRLSRHGLAKSAGGSHPNLIYKVMAGGVWITTMPHAEAKERAARAAAAGMGIGVRSVGGWPVPTEGSARSYDAAVASREFAKHEMRVVRYTTSAVRPVYGARSLTGCSAAMAAA